MKRIMGIDPGIRATGFALVENGQLLDFGVIRTSAKSGFADKLYRIYLAIKEVLDRWRPELAAMENVIYHRNVKSALTLGAVRGVVMLALREQNVEIVEFSPTRIKLAVTGNGRASKEQIKFMVKKILGLDGQDISEHVADASACAITALRNI